MKLCDIYVLDDEYMKNDKCSTNVITRVLLILKQKKNNENKK